MSSDKWLISNETNSIKVMDTLTSSEMKNKYYLDHCMKMEQNNDYFVILREQIKKLSPLNFIFVFTDLPRQIRNNKEVEIDKLIHLIISSVWTQVESFFKISGNHEMNYGINVDNEHDKHLYVEIIFPFIKVSPTNFEKLYENVINELSNTNDALSWNYILQPMQNEKLIFGSTFNYKGPNSKVISFTPENWGMYTNKWKYTNDQLVRDKVGDLSGYFADSYIFSLDPANCDIYLPILFSVFFGDPLPTQVKNTFSESPAQPIEQKYSQIGIVKQLLPKLTSKRVNNLASWREIGKILHNTFYQSDETDDFALELFKNLTKEHKCEFNADEFWEQNRTETENGLSEKTLAHYVRLDTPEIYKEWTTEWIDAIITELVENEYESQKIFAEVFYPLLWLNYISSGPKLYYFDGQCIKEDTKTYSHLSKEMDYYFTGIKKKIELKIANYTMGSTENKTSDKKCLLVKKFITAVSNSTSHKGVHYFFVNKVFNSNFTKFLNKNFLLTVWKNTTVEIVDNKPIMRKGKLEDFCTKFTNVEMPSKSPSGTTALYDWLDKVFPDTELRDYFIRIIASCLHGKNTAKNFYVMCGSGNNSKSMLIKLITKVFSTYSVDLPDTILCENKRSAGQASPEIAMTEGAHIAFVSEPKHKELDASTVKRLTGGDAVFTRKLNENGGSIDMCFKLFYNCNSLPSFDNVDDAVKQRVLYIPFLAKFAKDAPENPDEQRRERQFPLDPHFEEKLNSMVGAMAYLIFTKYSDSVKYQGVVPEIITVETKKYWVSTCKYLNFIKENIVPCESPENKVSDTDLFRRYRLWAEITNHGKPTQTKPLFFNILYPKIIKEYPNSKVHDSRGRSYITNIKLSEMEINI